MAKVKFISTEQLMEMMENKEPFVLIEVLPKSYYDKGHLPNAINIPVDKIRDDVPKLVKKSQTIVVYCASYHCRASTTAAKMLMQMGYKKVVDYKAGKQFWEDHDLEMWD